MSNLVDNEAGSCYSQRLKRFCNEFSCSCKTSKMFEISIEYPGVYKVFEYFFGAFSMVLNILTSI